MRGIDQRSERRGSIGASVTDWLSCLPTPHFISKVRHEHLAVDASVFGVEVVE